MNKIVIAMLTVLAVSACSSAPKKVAQKPQYCHTSQTILTKNGEKVESQTLVECTDNQFKRLANVQIGLSKQCGVSTRTIEMGGRLHVIEIKSCRVFDSAGNYVGIEYVD